MPEERVQKNGDAIIAGDFTFELEGNWLQKFFKGFFKKKYEDTACEMMAMHYAFYEELNKVGSVQEEEYVTREATICCSNGTEMVQLDAYEDHGILAANEKPLMTCSDCEVNKNIYSFGTCKCGNIYSEKLPHPSEEGEPDEHGKVRYKCIPVLCGNWKQVTGNLLIAEGENFVEALRSGAFLTCIYGGKITVVGIPEKETDEENISSEALISLDNLDDFGFFIGINSKEREAGIKELKRVLIKYNITSNEEIAFFMGEVAKESNFGTRTVEMFSGDDPEEYFNNRYSNNSGLGNKGGNDGELYRGAGYIHLTGRYNYEKFAEYIEDDEIVTRGYKVVGGEYNKDVSDIEPGEVGVIDIGEYAWESAGWFWTEGNPKGCNLNDFVAKLDWKSVSEAINKGDKGTFVELNGYINDFYEILTGKSLGLPDSLE